ncbi:hypothetical protein ANCCAN_03295 [Ancylostoma caninum]|uniref:Uncharacterized protein n=1 Tax=Ancylostoma caninum TaxID=29170 RepID=A0A368H246_ANCCA|nr:hypothetical protein ANCCAN_03295 [Ancylostoma caninum]
MIDDWDVTLAAVTGMGNVISRVRSKFNPEFRLPRCRSVCIMPANLRCYVSLNQLLLFEASMWRRSTTVTFRSQFGTSAEIKKFGIFGSTTTLMSRLLSLFTRGLTSLLSYN